MAGTHEEHDRDWTVRNRDGTISWDGIQTAVLMDIRGELKRLNQLLHCANFQAIPFKLDRIRINTTKRRKRRAKKS